MSVGIRYLSGVGGVASAAAFGAPALLSVTPSVQALGVPTLSAVGGNFGVSLPRAAYALPPDDPLKKLSAALRAVVRVNYYVVTLTFWGEEESSVISGNGQQGLIHIRYSMQRDKPLRRAVFDGPVGAVIATLADVDAMVEGYDALLPFGVPFSV